VVAFPSREWFELMSLPPEEMARVPKAPGTLDEAFDALESDHKFLMATGARPQRVRYALRDVSGIKP
jgi:glutamine synthetase